MYPAWNQAWPLETGTGPDINPDVVADGTGNIFAAWQNLTAGNWDINETSWQTTGIAERPVAGRERLAVSPNPFRTSLTLAFSQREREGAKVRIFDATGRAVLESHVPGSDSRVVLDLGSLPAGAYIARVTTAHGEYERSILHLR